MTVVIKYAPIPTLPLSLNNLDELKIGLCCFKSKKKDVMKQDINSEEDIKLMVDSFYAKVNEDEMLSYVFNDFSKVNWEEHLPKMYRFWSSLIFGSQAYKGNPFAAHIPLPVDEKHFNRWIEIFNANMDELFDGLVADQVKLRARSIAHVFQSKLSHINA